MYKSAIEMLFFGYQGSPREVTKTCFILSFLHTIVFHPLSIHLLGAAVPYISNHFIKKNKNNDNLIIFYDNSQYFMISVSCCLMIDAISK